MECKFALKHGPGKQKGRLPSGVGWLGTVWNDLAEFYPKKQ